MLLRLFTQRLKSLKVLNYTDLSMFSHCRFGFSIAGSRPALA
jgi:hypothetical protein